MMILLSKLIKIDGKQQKISTRSHLHALGDGWRWRTPAKFIIFNTRFLVFDTEFLVFNARFIIFTHASRTAFPCS